MNKFLETIHDMIEIITGKRPVKSKDNCCKQPDCCKPKRARTKGRYKADDKSTNGINEAWVGGKAPDRVKTVGYKKRKK